MKASYAYGPVTVSYSENEFDGAGTAVNTDQEVTAYEVAYTVSDAISISYGAEDIKTPDNASDEDMDIRVLAVEYDEHGERYRDWRSAIYSSSEEVWHRGFLLLPGRVG